LPNSAGSQDPACCFKSRPCFTSAAFPYVWPSWRTMPLQPTPRKTIIYPSFDSQDFPKNVPNSALSSRTVREPISTVAERSIKCVRFPHERVKDARFGRN